MTKRWVKRGCSDGRDRKRIFVPRRAGEKRKLEITWVSESARTRGSLELDAC